MSKTLFCLILCVLFAPGTQAASHDVFGTFLTEEENSHIKITDCGDGTPCGHVVWLDPTKLESGLTPEQIMTKAGKPVLGLLMLQNFSKKKTDWRDGTIYAPDKDKTYASRLLRLDNGSLEVKGCISFFCQTQVWTPVLEPELESVLKPELEPELKLELK